MQRDGSVKESVAKDGAEFWGQFSFAHQSVAGAMAGIPTLKYDFNYRVEYPGRRPGEHHKNAEEGEEV
jgi:hypothetical protein